ncbi:MAG: (2Fe-2S)-binding protein [Nitrososphaeria archaeon]
MPREISVKVNGKDEKLVVKDNELLLDVLRDKLQLKSVKASCWRGECGLCTVLLNGAPVKSCLILAAEVEGSEVTTVEGLSKEGVLSPIQKAFIENGALQCGFCTPAFVLLSHHLLTANPDMSEEEIREGISGLICRCGTYKQIVNAIKAGAPFYKSSS